MYALEPFVRHYLIYLEKYRKWLRRNRWRAAFMIVAIFLWSIVFTILGSQTENWVLKTICWIGVLVTVALLPFLMVSGKILNEALEEVLNFKGPRK